MYVLDDLNLNIESIVMNKSANTFMELAFAEAIAAEEIGEVPVGAVVVDSLSGEVISAAGNRVEVHHDPSAHAELIAIQRASHKRMSPRLINCDLYVTLEPCPMCAQAISYARIRRLYFGALDSKGGGVESGARIFHQSSCKHTPEIYGGLSASRSANMLRKFFHSKR